MRKLIATTVADVSLILLLPPLTAGANKGSPTHSPPGLIVQQNIVDMPLLINPRKTFLILSS